MTGEDPLVDQLIDYYGRLSRHERPDLDYGIQDDTPWETLRQLAQEDDPERAWGITKELLYRAPDSALGYIAAGPLEDLISFHGSAFIDRLEAHARDNSRLATALEAVTVDGWVDQEVQQRLRRICPNLRIDRRR